MLKVDSYSQRELKTYHILSLILYYVLTFVFPIVYGISVISVSKVEVVKTYYRFPLIAVIVILLVLIAGIKLLGKSVDKINILQLNGEYNYKMLAFKMIVGSIVKALPAIIILFACVYSGMKLVHIIENIGVNAEEMLAENVAYATNLVHFYIKFVCHLLGFYIAGVILDKTLIYHLEEELEIRKKVAEQNAVQSRINNLTNIQ